MSLENRFHEEAKLKYFGYLRDIYVGNTSNAPLSKPGKDSRPVGEEEDLSFYNTVLYTQTLCELMNVPVSKIRDLVSGDRLENQDKDQIGKILSFAVEAINAPDISVDQRLQRELAEKVVSLHTLPGNLEGRLIDDPQNLVHIVRGVSIAKYLTYAASRDTEPLTKTAMWRFSMLNPDMEASFSDRLYDRPEEMFYNTPPVDSEISARKSILIVGTNAEVWEIRDKLGNEVTSSNGQLASLEYASRMESFWEIFFNSEQFLEGEVTKPGMIATSGYIRNYNFRGGETVGVKGRLTQIAEEFGIRIHFVEPTHI